MFPSMELSRCSENGSFSGFAARLDTERISRRFPFPNSHQRNQSPGISSGRSVFDSAGSGSRDVRSWTKSSWPSGHKSLRAKRTTVCRPPEGGQQVSVNQRLRKVYSLMFQGRSSSMRLAGWAAMRVMRVRRYASGSRPLSLAVSMML